MARGKQHVPTEATRGIVTALVGFGIPHEDIATYLGIVRDTLAKHYRAELDSGRIRANAAVISNFFKIASGKKGTPAVQMRAAAWWLEKLSGLVLTSPAPGDKAEADADLHPLSDDDLARIAAQARPRPPKGGGDGEGKRTLRRMKASGPVH